MAEAFGGASPSTSAAILTLHFQAPLTGTQLSRILRLSQPATVRLLEKLVEAGLVARDMQGGGKEVQLSLTPPGKARAEAFLGSRNRALNALLAPLPPEKRKLLANLLDDMLPTAVESRADARFLCRYCDHGICDGPACPIGRRAAEVEPREEERPK